MAKTQQTNVIAGNEVTKAARKPSKATVTKPQEQMQGEPAKALQALAATLVAATGQHAHQRASDASPAPAAVQAAVVLRGQGAVTTVQIKAGAVYRTKAAHNMEWWNKMSATLAAGPAPVGDLAKAGVPGHFVGYCLRRGYLTAA